MGIFLVMCFFSLELILCWYLHKDTSDVACNLHRVIRKSLLTNLLLCKIKQDIGHILLSL